MLPIIANESRTFLDKLLTGDRDFIQDLPKFSRGVRAHESRQVQEALALIQGMRPETRKQKVVLLMRLRAAQQVDEKEFTTTLDSLPHPLSQRFRTRSIVDRVLHFQERLCSGMECVDRLENAVGGDPYLDVTRASINDIQGKFKDSRRLARRAIEKEPTLIPAYLELLGVSLIEKNNDDTLAMLKEIDRKLHLQMNDLTKIPDYAGFVKSPQYKKWLLYLEQKKKPGPGSPAIAA